MTVNKIKLTGFNQKNIYRSPQYLSIIVLISIVITLIIKPMYGARAQTEKPTEASEESTILNIKKVIEDKKIELGQNNQVTNNRKQAYLAQVKRVSAETLTVLNNQLSVVIPVSEELEIIKAEKEITLDRIEVDDWVVVYSVLEENTPKVIRVSVTDKDFNKTERKIMLGTIVEIYSSNLLFNSRTGETNLSFLLNKDTQFLDVNGDKISLKDFYPQLQCLIVAKSKTDGQWQISSIKALADIN